MSDIAWQNSAAGDGSNRVHCERPAIMQAIPLTDLKQPKVDATFQFGLHSKVDVRSKLFPGVLHLFEHDYNPVTQFWYGAAEVDCQYHELEEIEQQGMGWEFMIVVRLTDGRGGVASLKNAVFRAGGDATCALITLVGLTSLVVGYGVPDGVPTD